MASSSDTVAKPSISARKRALVALLGAALLLCAGLSVWYGGRAAWADASTLRARWLVKAWRNGAGPKSSTTLWTETRNDLLAGLKMAPDNAQVLDDLAYLYAARAQGLGTPMPGSPQASLQLSLFDQAIASYRAAAALRPVFPYTWAHFALAKHLRGEHDAEFWNAYDKALKYGRNEAEVQPTLGAIAFAQWSSIGDERQQVIKQMVATAVEKSRARLLEMAQQNGVSLPGV